MVEGVLQLIHTGLVAAFNAPEFQLDDDDAQELAAPIAEYLKAKNVVLTPEQEALFALSGAAMKVYPPMIMSVYIRKKAEREGKGKILRYPPPSQAAPAPKENPFPAFDPTKIVVPKNE